MPWNFYFVSPCFPFLDCSIPFFCLFTAARSACAHATFCRRETGGKIAAHDPRWKEAASSVIDFLPLPVSPIRFASLLIVAFRRSGTNNEQRLSLLVSLSF
jgi:hypothetical protein